MRVLALNQFYPPDVAATGLFLHDLARTLAGRGHEVTVVASRRSYRGGGQYPRDTVLDGVRVLRVGALGFGRAWAMGRMMDYASYLVSALLPVVRTEPRPDVVLFLTAPPFLGLLGGVASRRGAKVAHWVLDLYPDAMLAHGMIRDGSLVHRFLAALARKAFRGDLVVALGSDIAQRAGPYTDRPVKEILPWAGNRPSPLSRDRVQAVRSRLGWGDGELVLLYGGNMGLGHTLDEFLEAALRLRDNAGVRWVFAGGGKRAREVEQFLRRQPGCRVEILPYVGSEESRERMAAADVHLVSMREAWQGCILPSKLQAAFAVGRPVIYVGPPAGEIGKWVEQSGGGWIAAEGDVEGLVSAVREAGAKVERERRGRLALAFADRHFSDETIPGRLCNMVEELAGIDRGEDRS